MKMETIGNTLLTKTESEGAKYLIISVYGDFFYQLKRFESRLAALRNNF